MVHIPGHVPTLDEYLSQIEEGAGNIDTTSEDPFSGLFIKDKPTQISKAIASENPGLDFLAQAAWGGIHGLTWGLAEFFHESKEWEDMNANERAGYITGEGLSLFTPFVGPFALLGKAGRGATKLLGGNRYIRKAASNLIKTEGNIASSIVRAAEKEGTIPLSMAKGLQGEIKKYLPKGLKNKYSVDALRNLGADQKTAETASVFLRAQSQQILGDIFKRSGVDASGGLARSLSKNFVDELGKGRYVNDIGEALTRRLGSFGGKVNPGRISKYFGMAANDYLYMGLHALGTEGIKSVATGNWENYKEWSPKEAWKYAEGRLKRVDYLESLRRTGIMALGFPLVRGIKWGGQESLKRGIGAYFQRYKKLNYKKLSELPNGDKLVRRLLDHNVRGANINIKNGSDLADKFWKIGGKTYNGGDDILGQINTMPTKHVVGLLNKMRRVVSQEYVRRWRGNYFKDLWQSLPRMGTGILFMQYGAFKDGSFAEMSTQELASHLFMGGLMTKGRGAWDHAGQRGYISNEYGDMRRALNFLQVDHTQLSSTLKVMENKDLIDKWGAVYGHNPYADTIVDIFDGVFEGGKVEWRNQGEYIDQGKYRKVEALLANYNAIKKSKNIEYDPIMIDQMNPHSLDMVARSLGDIEVAGKKIDRLSTDELTVELSKETRSEIIEDHYNFLGLLANRLKIPFQRIPGVKGRATIKEITSSEDGQNSYPNVMQFQKLIKRYSPELGLDVIDEARSLEELARENNMSTRDFDNALGELIGQHFENMGSKHVGHNSYMELGENIYLQGLKRINKIEAQDDLYKVVTGVKSDKVDLNNLRTGIMKVFGVDGKLHKDIFSNKMEGQTVEEALSAKVSENLGMIQPIYDLIRDITGAESSLPKTEISSGSVKEVAELSRQLLRRLPHDWQLEPYAKGIESFSKRIFSGGNKLSFTAFERAREKGLIIPQFKNGFQLIEFPTELVIDNAFDRSREGRQNAEAVKEAVDGVVGLFNPRMVKRVNSQPVEADMLDWIAVHNEVTNSKVKDFVDTIGETLESLNIKGVVPESVNTLKSIAKEVQNEIKTSRLTVDKDKITRALTEVETIQGVLTKKNKLSQEALDKLDATVKSFKEGVDDMLLDTPLLSPQESIKKYGEVIKSFDELLQAEMGQEAPVKADLRNLLVRLHNHITNIDRSIDPVTARQVLDKLTSNISTLVGKHVSEKVTLKELIDEFNASQNWVDAKTLLESIYQQMGKLNTGQESYDTAAERLLEQFQTEKLNHEHPVNLQEMLLRYESIRSPDDPNKVDNQFVLNLSDAFDPGLAASRAMRLGVVDNLLNETIYNDIRSKYKGDASRQQLEIQNFRDTELQPLLQNIFGKELRSIINIDHNIGKMESKHQRYSLSTRTLDRKDALNLPGEKYDFLILNGAIKLKNKSINLDDSIEMKGNWRTIQRLIDRAIDVDMTRLDTALEQMRDINYKLKIEDIDDIRGDEVGQEPSTKVYMRLSPKMRILFPKTPKNLELLNADFAHEYSEKLAEYQNKVDQGGSRKQLDALERGFEHLLTGDSSNSTLRLKMMFVHYVRNMDPMFDDMMSRMDVDRGKIEFNSFKRGFLADGGTTTPITKEALEWGAEFDPDPLVREFNSRMLTDGTAKVGLINDQTDVGDHFFRNKDIVEIDINNKSNVLDSGSSGNKILNAFRDSILGDKYDSLNSFFLDGGKIAGTGASRSFNALKGKGRWNGIKTIIMDPFLLGKGFTVYDPVLSPILDQIGVDILVGKTVAKTLKEGMAVPFTVDAGTKTNPRRVDLGWEQQLLGMNETNKMHIPYENLGIAFTTHSDVGVNYSSSQFDFQDVGHLRQAKKLYKIDKLIEDMGTANNERNFANGGLLRALYDIRQRESGLQLTQDNFTLTETLVNYGAREANPLVQRALLRLLQGEFYKVLSRRPTQHGEEGISAANTNNNLSNPVYATFKGLRPAEQYVGEAKGTYDSIYQYGGGSITQAMADKTIENIYDIPFILRDPQSGLDLYFSFNSQDKLEMKSSFLETQEKIKGKEGYIEGLNNDGNGKGTEWIEVSPSTIKEMESVLLHLNKQVAKAQDITYGDLIHLLRGQEYDVLKRNTQGVPFALKKTMIDLAAKYNIELGMSINAIPKMLKDQPLLRIQEILRADQAGLATINAFDLRVTLQRDLDGDHIYKYLKMPMSMLKDYVDDMGDITDYTKLENTVYSKGLGSDMNVFGFGNNGRAGEDMLSIGFDKVAHDIAQKKKYLSGIISRKGTISYLLNSGIKFHNQPFVREGFNKKGYDIFKSGGEILDMFQRSGEMFQSGADVWNRTTELKNLDELANYWVFGELPDGIGKPSAHHSEQSFFSGGFGSKPIEKQIFRIIHRTLSKSKIMDNDVYEQGTQRQPTTDELRRAATKIDAFFDNPDLFLMKELMSEARRKRKKGLKAEATEITDQMVEYFFKDVPKGSKTRENVKEALTNGNIDMITQSRSRVFTINKDTSPGIKSTMSGHVLDGIRRKSLFYESDSKTTPDRSGTIYKLFNNLKEKINTMMSFGDITPEEFDQVMADSKAFQTVKDGKGVFDANLGGILRFVANRQYEREVSTLRVLNNENFPDLNKIERSEDRLATSKQMVDALDRQLAQNVILRKEKDVTMVHVPKSKDNSMWEYKDFKLNGNLYRVAGQVNKGDLKDKSTMQYMGTVSDGKNIRVLKGSTYVIDKRPPKFVSMRDHEASWNRAWAQATDVEMLKAHDFFSPEMQPTLFNQFITDVGRVRRDVNDSYSKALDAAKADVLQRKDIYSLNSILTDRMLGEFFEKYGHKHDFERLMTYLIQPQIQQNAYYKEGSLELPYYKMNTHLIESVFNWLRRPIQQGGTNADKFGYNAGEMLRKYMNDMNGYHDNRLHEVESRTQDYNRMRVEGMPDWERLLDSTGDMLLGDWYHNPLLSNYNKDFFLGRGNIIRRKDPSGKNTYHYYYGRDKRDWSLKKAGCK